MACTVYTLPDLEQQWSLLVFGPSARLVGKWIVQ